MKRYCTCSFHGWSHSVMVHITVKGKRLFVPLCLVCNKHVKEKNDDE